MDCFPQHHAKYPLTIHKTIPIAALGRNYADYLTKYETLKKGEAELRRNLEEMDKFASEFEDLIQKCVNYLTEYRSWQLQLLQTERAELSTAIEAAVQETAYCLNQGTQPVGWLAQVLWFLPSEQFSVVSYSVTTPNLQTLCGSWASYQNNWRGLYERLNQRPAQFAEEEKQSAGANRPHEMFSAEFQSSVFPYVHGNKVEMYNLLNGQSTNHTISVDFGSEGCFIQVDSQTLLCLGANPASTGVYELNLSSLTLTSLPSLRSPRMFAGVAKAGHIVYVFGGQERILGTHLKSCEKYALQDKKWFTLSDMHEPRRAFTPCERNRSNPATSALSSTSSVLSIPSV